MVAEVRDLWALTRGRPQIDPNDLAGAVTAQVAEADLDYRTRLLVRDSVEALRSYWGTAKWQKWLDANPRKGEIEAILGEEFDKVGFPLLAASVMEKTEPEVIRQFFDHLGRRMRKDVRIYVAGSVALILPGFLARHTQDIDVVDEVPEEIRENHQLTDELKNVYRLYLGHVQSHYFPTGWRDRAHYFDYFEGLTVYLVDVYDVFLSKLFSARAKDMGDLRLLVPQLDKQVLIERLQRTCGSFLATSRLLQLAQDNWHILFGEDLPHEHDTAAGQG
jgi:hypothetical protein